MVRSIAESDPRANTENHAIKEAIAAGEMVPKKSIDKLIENQLLLLSDKKGIIIDGYPRDMNQVKDFEVKVSRIYYFQYWFSVSTILQPYLQPHFTTHNESIFIFRVHILPTPVSYMYILV